MTEEATAGTERRYSRECHSRFVLSRLKCTFKGNRKRRCNFPRETEHEIKRVEGAGVKGDRGEGAVAAAIRPPFLSMHPSFRAIRLSDTSPVYFSLRSPSMLLSMGFNDNLPERDARPSPHRLPVLLFRRVIPPWTVRGATGKVYRVISRARRVLKIEKNARRENCISLFPSAEGRR